MTEERISYIVRKLTLPKDKIPTTFIPLAPDKLGFEDNADVLAGVFHIMWDDMPRRRTYKIRLQELISNSGDYAGACLKCGHSNVNFLDGLDETFPSK